ncbi:MAG TPA: hypothetical protein VE869_00565 [Gemmatimonas sp.]|nr:hypothetical protein [Gemmatimonas sp.]
MKSSRVALLSVAIAASVVAGCSESFDGGGACPLLCPAPQQQFRDTVLDAVTVDTTIGGFPILGLSQNLLLTNRPDTIETRAVVRFDVLASEYSPNNTGASTAITAIDSAYLRLPLDSTGRLGTAPVTLSVFDIDSTDSDTSSTVLRSLFRADRLLGSVTFTPSATKDSLRVPLNRARLLPKVTGKTRLRVGLRITSGTGQLRIAAFRAGIGAPTLTYDASTDTVYRAIIVPPSTSIPTLPVDAQVAYQVYSIIDRGDPSPRGSDLAVGGLPSARSYLRFSVPRSITDSGTIVRAELFLTQRPSTFGSINDTIALVPLVPTSTDFVQDLRRILELSAEGALLPVDSIRLVPKDSGQRVVNLINLVRTWPSFPSTQPKALAFRIGGEGAQPSELRFFSSEAAPGLRPRLRITYLPRTQTALP